MSKTKFIISMSPEMKKFELTVCKIRKMQLVRVYFETLLLQYETL